MRLPTYPGAVAVECMAVEDLLVRIGSDERIDFLGSEPRYDGVMSAPGGGLRRRAHCFRIEDRGLRIKA